MPFLVAGVSFLSRQYSEDKGAPAFTDKAMSTKVSLAQYFYSFKTSYKASYKESQMFWFRQYIQNKSFETPLIKPCTRPQMTTNTGLYCMVTTIQLGKYTLKQYKSYDHLVSLLLYAEQINQSMHSGIQSSWLPHCTLIGLSWLLRCLANQRRSQIVTAWYFAFLCSFINSAAHLLVDCGHL